MKAKREKMHYSYNDVAELLGVHLSTYRLWEKQLTTHYTRFVEQRVIAYLNDDLQKKKEHLQNRVPITDEIRKALKAKREKLHYLYNDVAELLGVHWATYRKWELQSTTHYSGLMEQRVIAYLNDDLSGQANDAADMEALEKLVNRQKSVFRLLSNDLKMQMKFFSDMEKLLDKTLDKYSIIHQNNAEEE
ncbi:MAG: hypothetical protein IKX48_16120 [Victivallales bacterium]|nr:hypothetical protein [Victivallales bacterium]